MPVFHTPNLVEFDLEGDSIMDRGTYLQDGSSEVPNGLWPLQIYGVNLTRLTPQAHFNLITPYPTNPNLTLTSLNTAVQIANLVMYRGRVRTDGQRQLQYPLRFLKQVAQWALIAHHGASIMFGDTIIYDAQRQITLNLKQ